MTRRDLGRMAAALVAARTLPARAGGQTTPPATRDVRPLTGIDRGLDDRRFDPVVFARDLYASAPRRLRFQSRTRADAARWQQELRSRIAELVGGFPDERPPLRAQA